MINKLVSIEPKILDIDISALTTTIKMEPIIPISEKPVPTPGYTYTGKVGTVTAPTQAKPGEAYSVKVSNAVVISTPKGAGVEAYITMKNEATGKQIDFTKFSINADGQMLATTLNGVAPTSGGVRVRVTLFLRNAPDTGVEWKPLDVTSRAIAVAVVAPPTIEPAPSYTYTGSLGTMLAPFELPPGQAFSVAIRNAWVKSSPINAEINAYIILKNDTTGVQIGSSRFPINASGQLLKANIAAVAPKSGFLRIRVELLLYKAPNTGVDWKQLDMKTQTITVLTEAPTPIYREKEL